MKLIYRTILNCVVISLFTALSYAQTKPNILWIVTEDISPTLSMYGDFTAKTPHLDELAAESMIYDNAFATVGVCAPARSSIITGMYPISIGTMHMRTGKDYASWGKRKYEAKGDVVDVSGDTIREYAAVIPHYIILFPEYLRAEGYFCTNNSKTDYQFASPISVWDENSNKAHWRNRPENTPFFSVFNINVTHESRLWLNRDKPLSVAPEDVTIPPYLVNNATTRNDIARHYSNVEFMDAQVGALIKQLKENGLYNNTIIFFYSDHGGPMPREKRAIYDSGLKVPFFVKDIDGKTRGRNDRMISFVDLAPTILSLANIQIPKYMQGEVFMGSNKKTERGYIFGSSDRFDEYSDRSRAVRNKEFLYVKNYFPDLIKYKNVGYRRQIPMMDEMLKLKDEGLLNDQQMIWFDSKTSEEIYDVKTDPYQMNNLIDNPKYEKALEQMRSIYDKHKKSNVDMGTISEAKLINNMWPNFEQPTTENPQVIQNVDGVILSSKTQGSSIVYLIGKDENQTFSFNDHWQLYKKPLKLTKGEYIYAMAERIGYKESETIVQIIK